MEFIKCIKVLFQKALTLGTPPKEEVLYSKVIQKEVPKENTEKHRLQTAIETIGNALKDAMSIAEHEEGVEFGRGTPTPPPKKPKPVIKKSANKEPKAKKEPTSTKKTVNTKKETPAKKTVTQKTTAKTKSTTTKIETDKKSVAKKPAVKKSETKTATKKAAPKKTMEKKTVSEKKATPEKKKVVTTIKSAITKKKDSTKTADTKTTAKKPSAKPATTKKAEKIALYTKDIQKHYGEVDNDFLAIIVKNLGPSIYKKDAELVSCSDPKELDTVRKNFLMKKLGINASQKVLDAAIEDVCEELKATQTKYRATFYYSLAKKFKKESVLS